MQRFTLTEAHIKLLRSMYVESHPDPNGSPCINQKRPYGNSDVEADIARILEWSMVETRSGEDITVEQAEAAGRIHSEMSTVLQIVLATGSFESGVYVADDYRKNWRLETDGK